MKESIFLKKCILVDCLANVGADVVYFSNYFEKIYAFEPRDKENEALNYNINLYNLKNIETFKKNIMGFLLDNYDKKINYIPIYYINFEFIDHNKNKTIGDYDLRYPGTGLNIEEYLKKIRDNLTEINKKVYYIAVKHPYDYPIKKIMEIFKSPFYYPGGSSPRDIIASYESGDSYTPDPLNMVKGEIIEVLNNWDYNKIEKFFEVVSELLGDKDLRVIVDEYINSELGKSKMREMLLDLKNNNVLDYARVSKELGNNPIFADVFSDMMRDDANIIKGGSMMRRFGFGDKN